MGGATLCGIPLTRTVASLSGHPCIHRQFNSIRRLHISSRLRLTSLHALRPSAFVGGGDGDGGSDSEVLNSTAAIEIDDEISDREPDFIVLDVTGMTCGGCASSVKRILESQPKVSSSSVDLAKAIATVWPIADAMEEPEWRKQLGQALATHLTNCGFQSNIRG